MPCIAAKARRIRPEACRVPSSSGRPAGRLVERGGGMRFPEAAEQMPEQAPGDAIIFRGDEPQAAAPVEAGSRMTAVLWFQQAGER